jgi:Ni/Co efflux regulator RcnB
MPSPFLSPKPQNITTPARGAESMKKFTLTLTLASLLATAAIAQAQDDDTPPADPRPPVRQSVRRDVEPSSIGSPPPSVQTWIYEQERKRYLDPKEAVRRNAEYRAVMRQRRIESRNWFGYSLSRPIASPNPWHDTYSPMWTGNSAYPYEWSGVGGPAVVYHPGWNTAQY